VPLTREPAAGEPSAMDWMRAFPRRLVLQPGQRQVVRVLVEPPPELPDGEYWARVLVSSRGGQPPIEDTQGDVQLQLNVQTTLVMAANYRNGAVGTGVEVARAAAVRTGGEVSLEVDLQRTGNAAFLGRLRADVLDARGTVVATAWDDIAVYRTMLRRLAIALPEGTAGPLEVRLTIDTEREDLPPGGALRPPTVTRSVAVAPVTNAGRARPSSFSGRPGGRGDGGAVRIGPDGRHADVARARLRHRGAAPGAPGRPAGPPVRQRESRGRWSPSPRSRRTPPGPGPRGCASATSARRCGTACT
jgi:hypothetical protein